MSIILVFDGNTGISTANISVSTTNISIGSSMVVNTAFILSILLSGCLWRIGLVKGIFQASNIQKQYVLATFPSIDG